VVGASSSPGLVPFVTHEVSVGKQTVVKRFRSGAGDEPAREWQALTLLARYAPGLAPDPVRADLQASPPEVVMSRLAGEPLGTRPATGKQVGSIAAAMRRLHEAIPEAALDGVRPAGSGDVGRRMRALAAACPPESLESLPRQAYDAALDWLDHGWADRPSLPVLHPVFAHGDANLANRLWDGTRVRLVDFEVSGRDGRAQELADFVEHISVWARARIDADDFLDRFDLTPAERQQIRDLRRLAAAHWVMILLPSGSAHDRNPPGTLERQAARLLDLLG
jgi:Ser/Thr protein kinase RdoA (MazF antagonist)